MWINWRKDQELWPHLPLKMSASDCQDNVQVLGLIGVITNARIRELVRSTFLYNLSGDITAYLWGKTDYCHKSPLWSPPVSSLISEYASRSWCQSLGHSKAQVLVSIKDMALIIPLTDKHSAADRAQSETLESLRPSVLPSWPWAVELQILPSVGPISLYSSVHLFPSHYNNNCRVARHTFFMRQAS